MSIIVEGPDGAGKTTLVQELQHHFPKMELHPRFCTSTGGPIADLTEAVFRDVKTHPTHYIYDRHPVISEYIYNTSIPERAIRESFLSEAMGRLRERVARHSLVIWCLPPLDHVMINVLRDEEDGNQMSGVANNIERIYEQYRMHRVLWPGKSIIFDYTERDRSWDNLNYLLSLTRGALWLEEPNEFTREPNPVDRNLRRVR
jgi:adenylate kinase family enzyme